MNSLSSLKRSLVGAAAAFVFALAGPGLSAAQETTASTAEEQKEEAVALTTEEKICEAQQRTEARWQKWINEGIPEEFGSEEPFTFDPSLC